MEKSGFVIRISPINVQAGQQAEIILQTNDGLAYMHADIPHMITTKADAHSAQNLKADLEKHPFSALNVNVQVRPYAHSRDNFVVQASGDRDALLEIKRRRKKFVGISVSKYLRMVTGFPFAKVTDGKFCGEQASPDEILSFGDAALDIETNKPATPLNDSERINLDYTEINTATLAWRASETGGEAVTVFDCGRPAINISGVEVPIRKVRNGKVAETLDDVMRKVRAKKNTLFLHTYNGMSYDLLKLRELEEFEPAQDETAPKITAHVKDFSKRVEIKDYIVIDYLAFARNYFSFLPIKTLEQFCNFNKIDFKKEILRQNYDAEVLSAQQGNIAAAEGIVSYNARDTFVLFKLADAFKPAIVQIAKQLGVSPEAVCATSKKQNAKEFWDRAYFLETRMLPHDSFGSQSFVKFDIAEEKTELFMKNARPDVRTGLLNGNFYIVRLDTATRAFDFIRTLEIFRAMENSGGAERFCYSEALESICEQPLADLLHNSPDYVFTAKYGEKIANVKAKLGENILRAWQFLGAHGLAIANYSNNFLVLEGGPGLELELNGSGAFTVLGTTGHVLSISENKFITHVNGCFIASGIDAAGSKGDATELEKEVVPYILREIVVNGNYSAALQYVYEQIWLPLANKTLDRKKLLFRKKIMHSVGQMSERAQERASAAAQRELDAKVGETLLWGYSLASGKRKELRSEKFVKFGCEVDWQYYHDQYFGEDSKVMGILEACKASYNSSEREIFRKLKTYPSEVTLELFAGLGN